MNLFLPQEKCHLLIISKFPRSFPTNGTVSDQQVLQHNSPSFWGIFLQPLPTFYNGQGFHYFANYLITSYILCFVHFWHAD